MKFLFLSIAILLVVFGISLHLTEPEKQTEVPVIYWVNSKDFEGRNGAGQRSSKRIAEKLKTLRKYDAILVPGGFGETGIDGKLHVIRYAREKKIPYLGLCYGMQLAIVEYARNVLGIKDANTYEIDPDAKNLVIDVMPDQKKKLENGSQLSLVA